MLNIGILGAARIAPPAVIEPASIIEDVQVVSVAARKEEKATLFAQAHQIPRTHATYEELIADPDIHIIYNPLPNGLHAEWSIKALQAGKHVLCEKPIASNAEEATKMAEVAQTTGNILCEAFHYRYHPMATRLKDLYDSQIIGPITLLESTFCAALWNFSDIRYRYDLAGGSVMDLGCYPIHLLRFLTGQEPKVEKAVARTATKFIDRYMEAELSFPDGVKAKVYCGMVSLYMNKRNLIMHGSQGNINARNPFVPHTSKMKNKITINKEGQQQQEEHIKGQTTYYYQLKAFKEAIINGNPLPTDSQDAIANMRVIDDIYRKSGLPIRGDLSVLK